MKKIVLVALCVLGVLPVRSEIYTYDMQYPENNELYMDSQGTIRYKFYPSDALNDWKCDGAYSKEMKAKCMEARNVLEQKVRQEDKNKNADKTFTGKLRFEDGSGLSPIFYIKNGIQGDPLYMIQSNYYIEADSRGTDYIYSVETEEPFTGEFVLGKVHVPTKGGLTTGDYWAVFTQAYVDGLPDGKPVVAIKTAEELNKGK